MLSWLFKRMQEHPPETESVREPRWRMESSAMDLEIQYEQRFSEMLIEQCEAILKERETNLITDEVMATAWHRLMKWKVDDTN